MKRLALALALVLVAGIATAQSDPKSNTGNRPVAPTPARGGGIGVTERIAGRVVVGERAPDFELPSGSGEPFRLKQARGHWVALFFTDRRDDLDRLSDMATTLDSLGFTTYVACHEKEQVVVGWTVRAVTHLMPLADEHGEIAMTYGLWDVDHAAIRPGMFLLDPQGIVKVALLGQRAGAPSLRGLVQSAVDGL